MAEEAEQDLEFMLPGTRARTHALYTEGNVGEQVERTEINSVGKQNKQTHRHAGIPTRICPHTYIYIHRRTCTYLRTQTYFQTHTHSSRVVVAQCEGGPAGGGEGKRHAVGHDLIIWSGDAHSPPSPSAPPFYSPFPLLACDWFEAPGERLEREK